MGPQHFFKLKLDPKARADLHLSCTDFGCNVTSLATLYSVPAKYFVRLQRQLQVFFAVWSKVGEYFISTMARWTLI